MRNVNKASMILAALLAGVSPFTAATATDNMRDLLSSTVMSTPVNTWHPHERFLQTDVCVSTAARDFTISTLGPSAFRGSLYRTAGFSFGLPVEIDELAKSLVYSDLLITGSAGDEGLIANFVQEDEYFGRNGEHTAELLGQHALLADFWKIEASGLDLLLLGMHSEKLGFGFGSSALNFAVWFWAVQNGFLDLYAITDEEIDEATASVQEAIETELPNGYSNSVLTFTAFFVPWPRSVIIGNNTALIVIGDGYLDFDESLGLGEVGNDITHAHEYGHALQYIMDFDDAGRDYDVYAAQRRERTPESSRQVELEADAMAGYALAHEQGRNFSVPLLIASATESFFAGDCSTSNDSHHGTPRQRECATKWGADEGLDMTGDPVSMREFRTLFLENLDLILAIDPTVCQLTDDSVPVTPVISTLAPTRAPTATTPAAPMGVTNSIQVNISTMIAAGSPLDGTMAPIAEPALTGESSSSVTWTTHMATGAGLVCAALML